MEYNPNNIPLEEQDETINIKDFLLVCKDKWIWFLISTLTALFIATAYLLVTPNVYKRSASILIKENAKGNNLGGIDEAFSDMGFFKTRTNVKNEVIALKSPSLIYEVVSRMRLNYNYTSDGTFHQNTLYGSHLPMKVDMLDFPSNKSCKFDIVLNSTDNKRITLTNFEWSKHGDKIESKDNIEAAIGDTINTPLGKITLYANIAYQTPDSTAESNPLEIIHVDHYSMVGATGDCCSKLNISLHEKEASVIDLTYSDVNPIRAKDFLNTLIAIYNENWVKDKNQISISTSMFIKERLRVIEQELGKVDENISTFKSKNLLPDVKAVSSLYMSENSKMGTELMKLNNQLYMSKYIRAYLLDPKNDNSLIPANSGISSQNIEGQINEYNQELLSRNQLVASSSEQNPIVIDMDAGLKAMRQAVMVSINNQIETLNVQIESMQEAEKKNNSYIAQNPNQAKYLLSVERQQKVKEALYLFLLQKREETELSQAFSAYNTRIITPPMGSTNPIAPRKKMIMLAALLLGLLIAFAVIYIREMLNTKLRGRKDLENTKLPIIGEIPFTYKKHFFIKRPVNVGNNIVIEHDNHNIINEAFRMLRTNIEFSSGRNNKKVFIFTSFNPGSGKSFITMNLSVSLAIKNHRVLVIDGDLRHASVSKYIKSPKQGLSDYLNGYIDNIQDIIVKLDNYNHLDVLPVGTIPPNPSELLSEESFKTVIESLRESYDFILIDCPPAEIVADTQIVAKLADRTFFVARVNLLERSLIPTIEKLEDSEKFKNVGIIINGSVNNDNRYNKKYGYYSHK